MKHIKKIATYAVMGSFGAMVIAGLSGCGSSNDFENTKEQATPSGATVIVEESSPGKYKILEEFPSNETRVIVKQADGSERMLSKDEIDALMKQENLKIDNGTSELTNSNNASLSDGMSLGGILLSSIAGAMIGSWIGNKLFNNPNYQAQRQAAYKNPSAYTKSVNSFNNAKASSSKPGAKSGFFGGGNKNSQSNGA